MHDKIIVKDLLLRGIIGLNDWEREKPQDILINLTLFTDMRPAGTSDDPGDILNYRTITKDIIAYVESSQHYLVDHAAARAIVRVEKPGALRFAQSVGVEIERERGDFA